MILERTVTVSKPRRLAVTVERPGTSATVVVGRGLPGADGQDGQDGGATSHVERTFATASAVWEWDHALGYTPGVELMTSDRHVITGAITYNGPDRTRAEFYAPVAGIMGLS